MRPRSSLLLVLATCQLSVATASEHSAVTTGLDDQRAEPNFIADNGAFAQDPLQMGAMPTVSFDSPRHRQERAHLMKRMDRKHGKWTATHPRHRLLETLRGFTKYKETNMAELDRWRKLYKSVSKTQRKTLEKVVRYDKKLNDIEELIFENLVVCKDIINTAMKFYGIQQKELDEYMKEAERSGRPADRISVSQTLKHFVRDWADEGSKERTDAFPCILGTMSKLKVEAVAEKPLKVLLPGSGVGRLGHEVAEIGGFEVTVNEWSMYMNVGYRYIESRTAQSPFTIHPFIDGLSHHATTSDLLRKVTVPNVTPNPSVLLVEGDFNTAFDDQGGLYDIIVTHFFIDTARNLMAYFDTIQFLLKSGGKWLNLGPLLYGTGPFVQLSLDEIVAVVKEMGFEFEDIGDECGQLTFEGKKIRSTEAEYGFNGKALTKNAYKAQVWVARKL